MDRYNITYINNSSFHSSVIFTNIKGLQDQNVCEPLFQAKGVSSFETNFCIRQLGAVSKADLVHEGSFLKLRGVVVYFFPHFYLQDSKRFEGIDTDFKELAYDAQKTPNVVEATNKSGLYEKLEDIQSR